MSSSQLVAGTPSTEERLEQFFAAIHECRDKGYATHGIHPYPAKFIPHIPRELLLAYSRKGDTVWDPLCGSGTTLVEAAIAGRSAVGGDLNPIAVLVSKAKTTSLDDFARRELKGLTETLEAATGSTEFFDLELPEFHNRDHWFDPRVSQELAFALARVQELESEAAANLANCSFSAILVGVSRQESETRWSAVDKPVVPGRAIARLARRIDESVTRVDEYSELALADVRVSMEDARASSVEDESIELVVTSPPYANAHDYYLYNKLRMFWLGHEVRSVQDAEIGSRNKHSDRRESIETYLDAMQDVMTEMLRGLAKGGKAVIVVADAVIRGSLFKMDTLLAERGELAGFALEHSFVFDHRRFNSAFQRGFGTRYEKSTHVLVLKKG